MGKYYEATICQNGHVISKYDSNSQKFCSECGSKTYSNCTECGSFIRGIYKEDGVIRLGDNYKVPYYCYNCGNPYPWTQKILDNAVTLLALDDDLDEEMKKLIKEAIPNLIVDTPDTPVAVAKYKKGISAAGQVIKDSMRNLLVDILSETVKKMLFS